MFFIGMKGKTRMNPCPAISRIEYHDSSCYRVYVVIRLVIRIAEYLIARPKHRRLRRKMAHAKSYPEWYSYAAELDKSQKRDRWLRRDDDYASSKLYNWVFIRQLIAELKLAHAKGDSLMAMAVIQQCTRKVRQDNCSHVCSPVMCTVAKETFVCGPAYIIERGRNNVRRALSVFE